MSEYERLGRWLAAQPWQEKKCDNPECGKEFRTRFGKYCCNGCRYRAKRLRDREKELAAVEWRRCNWCGGELENPLKQKFCGKEHKWRFFAAKRWNKPIRLQIQPGLWIETRQYDRVDEVRREWLEKMERPRLDGRWVQ